MNYTYNLSLTRPGVSIIESDIDLKEQIGYFTLNHIMFALSDRE
jgi:hypothetical protein